MANDTSINNSSDVESEPAGPNQTPTPAVDQLYLVPGGGYQMWGTEVPTMPGTRVGDVIVNDAGDKWNWMKGDWDYSNLAKPPSRDKGVPKSGDEFPPPAPDYYNPAPQQSTFVPGTSPSITKREDQAIVTSGGSTLIQAPSRTPVVPLPTLPQETIQDLARPPIVPQKPNVSILPKYNQPALVEPTTVPIPARRADVLGSPYMGYVNYDPDEILAAAMRVMRGRGAGRSLMY